MNNITPKRETEEELELVKTSDFNRKYSRNRSDFKMKQIKSNNYLFNQLVDYHPP